MSTTLDARARLLAALEEGGVRTATTGQLSAPCVLVEPGEPWSEPARMPGRSSRWRLTLLAGKADTEGTFATLGDLIDAIDTALRPLAGCELPAWARPSDIDVGGVAYAASIATITYASS